MKETTKRKYVAQGLLAAWAMLTIILLFTVVLLAAEMRRQGIALVPTAPKPEVENSAAPVPEDRALHAVALRFGSADGRLLVQEARSLALSDSTVHNCRLALDALIEGSRSGHLSVVPPSTKCNGIFLLDKGELIVDFDASFRKDLPLSASSEALFAYAIVNTLAQEDLKGKEGAVVSVRFLFNGRAPAEQFEHIDLSAPLLPNLSWDLRSGG